MAKGKSRDGRREAQWRRAVCEHGRSGLSVREFCRRGELRETAFYFWRRELQRRKAEQEQRRPRRRSVGTQPVPVAFVPVTVSQDVVPHTSGRIEIELSGGRRVHVTAPVDRQALADVLLAVSDVERAVVEAGPC